MATKKYTTIRVYDETRKKLKYVAAVLDKNYENIIEEMVVLYIKNNKKLQRGNN